MASILTIAGENIFALKQAQGQVLNLDRFVLAYIPDLDPDLAIDRTEGIPAAENIVHTHVIPADRKGYVNPSQVVYSLQLTSDIGDFVFNWVGLLAEDDTVVAITHLPELDKWRNVPAENKLGNTLIRNIMLEYAGAREITSITVEADTWQIDWNVRLKGMDERERLSNGDIYGTGCFFGDAFLVVNNAGSFTMQPGVAYVGGIRISLANAQPIVPVLPADVYLDVSLMPTGSDVQPLVGVTYADPGSYVDDVNVVHFGQKIAEIAADGTVTDVRPKGSGALLAMLGSIYALLRHVHDEYALVDHEHDEGTTWSSVWIGEETPREFGSTEDTAHAYQFAMPPNWDGGNLRYKLYWTAQGGTVGDSIGFTLAIGAVGDGDTIDAALGAAVAVAVADEFVGTNKQHISEASDVIAVNGTPAGGELLHFYLTRDHDAGASPLNESVQVLGIMVQYAENGKQTEWGGA